MLGRRGFVTALGGAAAWPLASRAQQPTKMLRVGNANAQPRTAPQWVAFVERLAELGYVEGKNLIYDHVQIPSVEQWEATCRSVVERRPDIMVASGPEASLKAALAVRGQLPVVMIAVDYDPLARGYVQSLAQPAHGITGLYSQSTELVPKRLQLMQEAFPAMTKVIVPWDRHAADYWAAAQAAAGQLGIAITGIEFRQRPYDYERALAAATRDLQFVLLGASPFVFIDREELAALAIRRRLVLVSDNRELTAAGFLMSYGTSLIPMFRLAAGYVDRIARGVRPADLPIERPTAFELSVNLKTASALDLALPPSLLARADTVFE